MTTKVGTIAINDLGCPCNWEMPEGPRDFDFEGSFDALKRELELDSKETGCTSYKVLDDQGELLWAVWREL
jgi:hypothetical protein